LLRLLAPGAYKYVTGSKRRAPQNTADVRGAIRIAVNCVHYRGFKLAELNKERLDAVVRGRDRPFQAGVHGP
jgi:hypothetical protein